MGISGEAWLFVLLSVLLALAGIWLLASASRRRTGVQRYCATCDYPMTGLSSDAARCPECGADLTMPDAVATGQRRSDPTRYLAAIGLLLPALLSVVLLTVRLLHVPAAAPKAVVLPTPPPVRQIAPTTRPHENLTDTALVKRVLAAPAHPDIESLLKEAAFRTKVLLEREEYEPETWITRLIKAGLHRQGNLAEEFLLPWAQFVESLLYTPLMDDDDRRLYLKRAVHVEVAFRESVAIGATFPVEFRARIRVSPAFAERLMIRPVMLSIDDVQTDSVLRFGATRAGKVQSASVSTFSFSDEQWQRIPPGKHVARLTILVDTGYANYDWFQRIEKPVIILPQRPYQHTYTPGVDEAVARSLNVSARLRSSQADGLRWDGKRIILSLACDNAPVDIYAQVGLSVPGSGGSTLIGFAHWRQGESAVWESDRVSFDPFYKHLGEKLDVTLHGSPWNADSTLLTGNWWVGTVRFEGVTLADVSDPAAPPGQLTVPERQIHRPGTNVRPYGYFPVSQTAQETNNDDHAAP